MIKIRTILLLALLLFPVINSSAQKDRTLSNGFSIHAIIGIPADDYGWRKGHPVDAEYQHKSYFGLKIGNRWYFGDLQPFGVGLMVNWLDISTAVTSWDFSGTKNYLLTVETAVVAFGPVGTYAINPEMAVDAFYNLRPSAMVTAVFDEDGEDYDDMIGSGFNNALGAAFRWRALSVGFEYVFGKAKHVDSGDPDLSVNSFRFLIGAKF